MFPSLLGSGRRPGCSLGYPERRFESFSVGEPWWRWLLVRGVVGFPSSRCAQQCVGFLFSYFSLFLLFSFFVGWTQKRRSTGVELERQRMLCGVLNEGHSRNRPQPGVPLYLAGGGGRPRPAGVSGRRVTRRCRPGKFGVVVVVVVVAEANLIFRLIKHERHCSQLLDPLSDGPLSTDVVHAQPGVGWGSQPALAVKTGAQPQPLRHSQSSPRHRQASRLKCRPLRGAVVPPEPAQPRPPRSTVALEHQLHRLPRTPSIP